MKLGSPLILAVNQITVFVFSKKLYLPLAYRNVIDQLNIGSWSNSHIVVGLEKLSDLFLICIISMYTDYFGLIETPFKIIPDPRFLWYSDQHKEAKAKIEYHLLQKDGPVYLSADVGMGKTSIAQRLRDEFQPIKQKRWFWPSLQPKNCKSVPAFYCR